MGGRRRLGLPLSPAEAVRRLGRARPRPLWSGPLYALTGGRTCHGLGGPRTPGPEERILIVAGKRTEKSRSFFLMPLPFTLSAHKCAGGGGDDFSGRWHLYGVLFETDNCTRTLPGSRPRLQGSRLCNEARLAACTYDALGNLPVNPVHLQGRGAALLQVPNRLVPVP